jgi:hypothetical protein
MFNFPPDKRNGCQKVLLINNYIGIAIDIQF